MIERTISILLTIALFVLGGYAAYQAHEARQETAKLTNDLAALTERVTANELGTNAIVEFINKSIEANQKAQQVATPGEQQPQQ